MKRLCCTLALWSGLLLAAAGGCNRPLAPARIVARSVQAHGGDALSRWKTLTIRGTVIMNDGTDFEAAYLLFAEKPDKLRLEQDLTAVRGRLFYEYFLNGDKAWTRRNLIPAPGDLKRMRRMLHQCDGVAYYATNAEQLISKGDAVVTVDGAEGAETRPAYAVEAVIGDEATTLFFDKSTFYLIKEETKGWSRTFSDFKRFGSAVMGTRILEVRHTARGDLTAPIRYNTVEFDGPIEDWLFEEDMPAAGALRP